MIRRDVPRSAPLQAGLGFGALILFMAGLSGAPAQHIAECSWALGWLSSLGLVIDLVTAAVQGQP